MTTTAPTTTETEEVHFVNIISIAEDRLSTNFRVISNKMKAHDQAFRDHEVLIKTTNQHTLQYCNKMFRDQNELIVSLQNKFEALSQSVEDLQTNTKNQQMVLDRHDRKINNCGEEIKELKLVFEEGQALLQCQIDDFKNKVELVRSEIGQAYEMILKKEDSTEVYKIKEKISMVDEKCTKNEKDNMQLEHKFQKIEILGQKAEKSQNKKDFQLMKEIDEKIKKALKSINIGIIPTQQTKEQQISSISSSRAEKIQKVQEKANTKELTMQDEKNFAQQNSIISKLNDKIYGIQNRLKTMEKNMLKPSDRKEEIKDDGSGIKILERINEIKPQLIKIWANCDSLDEKISLNERKMEEKSKIITSLVESQKQNNFGKMDQKIKFIQTEMYTALKDLKGKIEGKVAIADFEKTNLLIDERIKQINELIVLKSDKIEVKKALLFLESKLKEIILVISEEQENQKDVLLTKKQLKCMSCDKDIEKLGKGLSSGGRDHWNALPMKQHAPEVLGRFGMTNFGSLGKRLKKLQSGDLPILNAKKNTRNQADNKQNSGSEKLNGRPSHV